MASDVEVAWAAGFFEGEGYFSAITRQLKDGPRRYPYVGLNNTDFDTLVRFQTIVGVGTIKPRKADTERFRAKDQWRWLASKRAEAEYVRDLFAPWLSERRKAQIANLFDDRGDLVRRIA